MEMINGTFWSRGTVSINQVLSWKTLSHTPLVALYWLLSAPSSSECWGWGSQFEDISWSWGGEWLEVNLQQQERIGNIHQRYWLDWLSGLPTVRRSIIGAVCDNFGGNKHIFWLNLEQKKLFNNISGATASGMEPVCKWNVADSAPAAAAVLLVMIRPPFVSIVHHCLSADGGICGRGSKPGHDAGTNGPYHPPCHCGTMVISSNKTLTGFSSIHSLPCIMCGLKT